MGADTVDTLDEVDVVDEVDVFNAFGFRLFNVPTLRRLEGGSVTDPIAFWRSSVDLD